MLDYVVIAMVQYFILSEVKEVLQKTGGATSTATVQ